MILVRDDLRKLPFLLVGRLVDLETSSSSTLLCFFLSTAVNVLLPFQDKLCLVKANDRTFVMRTVCSIIQNTE